MEMEFVCDKTRYYTRIDSRTNTMAIIRIAPYDFTEYHWARKSTDQVVNSSKWNTYREGKKISVLTFPSVPTEEEEYMLVAKELIRLDTEARLTSRIDHT